MTITVNNEDHKLPLLLLGVRKGGDGPQLLVYAKGKDPLLTLPLKKLDSTLELPIEIDARKGDNNTGVLTLKLLGKYQAELAVAEQES